MELLIDNRQNEIAITQKLIDDIKLVAKECLLLERESTDFEVSISFVDNEEIKRLNSAYRHKDTETDVLSFPLDNEDFLMKDQVTMLGDIVISVEKAKTQAEELGHSFDREILYLTAHSMLHLLGYDHMNEEDKTDMRQREKTVMKNLKIFRNE